jgi:hypothetical protein
LDVTSSDLVLRLAKPALFYQRRYVFSTHSYKLFGTTGIARGIRMTKTAAVAVTMPLLLQINPTHA